MAQFLSGPADGGVFADASRASRMDPVGFPLPPEGNPAGLYLDLVKRCLLNWPYADVELGARTPPGTDQARLEGRDWPRFYDAVRQLARQPLAQRHAALRALQPPPEPQ